MTYALKKVGGAEILYKKGYAPDIHVHTNSETQFTYERKMWGEWEV